MTRTGSNLVMSGRILFARFFILVVISIIVGLLTRFVWGLTHQQSIFVSIF